MIEFMKYTLQNSLPTTSPGISEYNVDWKFYIFHALEISIDLQSPVNNLEAFLGGFYFWASQKSVRSCSHVKFPFESVWKELWEIVQAVTYRCEVQPIGSTVKKR